MSPTQRSLKYLRGGGFTAAITEHWNSFVKIRQDLFGFGDIVAFKPFEDEVALVQTTSASGMSSRITKILAIPVVRDWLLAPHRTIYVHGWGKRGPRGKRKVWTVRVVQIFLKNGLEIATREVPEKLIIGGYASGALS